MVRFRCRFRMAAAAFVAALFLLCSTPDALAQDGAGKLSARPQPGVAAQEAAGISRFSHSAIAYRPPKASPGPLPLLVLLHGANGDSRQFLELFRKVADERGLQLLALQSKGYTWDAITRRELVADGDMARVDAVLGEFFGAVPVDPGRVMISGFSDGASYALALGLANPELFTSVIALSPGIFILPEQFDASQRVFIAHGKTDQVLPFQKTATVANELGPSVQLRFRRFDGGHEIDRDALSAGLDFALEGKP